MSESTVYFHEEGHSFKSKLLHLAIRVAGWTNPLGRTLNNTNFNSQPEAMPKTYTERYRVETKHVEGRETWTVSPKEGKSEQVILYIHGGAYVFNLIGMHWDLIGDLVDQTNATVVVANYPLAPQETASEAYAYTDVLYTQTLDQYEEMQITFMGDSSGGGFAIAYAQHLRDRDMPQPSQIIVLSPWLDVTMSNPDIPEHDDPAMRSVELRRAGAMFAGDIDTRDPRLSPIYGDFEGIAPIALFAGTHDLFIADCRKLHLLMQEQGWPIRYYEYPKMLHTWALFQMPESHAARAQMVELLKR